MQILNDQFLKERKDIESTLTAIEILGEKNAENRSDLLDEFTSIYKKYDTTYHKSRFETGIFDTEKISVFAGFLKNTGKIPSTCNNIFIFNEIIRRLESNSLIYRVRALDEEEYMLNDIYFSFKTSGLLDNVLFGIQYTIRKYLPVIPAINVTDRKTADQFCGTGIVIPISIVGAGVRYVVITNRHVVEPSQFAIDSVASKSVEFKVISDVYESVDSSLDLAAFEVSTEYAGNYLILGDDPITLDSIITVGFPRVPFTTAQYALSHSGEINGQVSTMGGSELLVISCNVNPGNSGGPVLTEDGRCVGVVTESLLRYLAYVYILQRSDDCT